VNVATVGEKRGWGKLGGRGIVESKTPYPIPPTPPPTQPNIHECVRVSRYLAEVTNLLVSNGPKRGVTRDVVKGGRRGVGGFCGKARTKWRTWPRDV